MITLPTKIRERATFRIQWMPEGQWTAAAGQPWTTLAVPCIFDRTNSTRGTRMTGTVAQGGYHVERITRWCLPDEDRAQFYIDTGLINGVTVTPIDLSGVDSDSPGCAIRIQVMDDEAFPNGQSTLPTGVGSNWKTVFVGTVIYQSNDQEVGITGNGRVTYYAVGILSRSRNWPLDRHCTANAPHAKGHPGYNIPLHGWFRKALGNKDASTTGYDPFGDMSGGSGYPDIHGNYRRHVLPIDGSSSSELWTDNEAVDHALASSRASGEPIITTNFLAGLFAGTYAWHVSPGDSCLDLLQRICNRQRGRGSVFMNYIDDTDPDGNVTLTLTALSSFPSDLSYNTTASYGDMQLTHANAIQNALLGTSAVNVDLNGDHRIVGNFKFDDRTSSVFDMVVVQGEPIQVLCNLNFFGSSLERRWSSSGGSSDEVLFSTIPQGAIWQLCLPRWRHVWRRFGIPQATPWAWTVKASPGGAAVGFDYYTSNSGRIVTDAAPGSTKALSSVMTARILPDLPIYEGYRYDSAGAPVRWDGSTEYLPPARMSPVVMYRSDSADPQGAIAWLPLHYAGFALSVDDFGIYITHPVEDQTGCRFLAPDTGGGYTKPACYLPMESGIPIPILSTGMTTTSGINVDKLNTIVGLELGTRVCLQLGPDGAADDYDTAGRRMTITVDGLHLWLGAPGAIWEFDPLHATQSNYKAGLTIPAGTTPLVLRDDRNALSFIACLASYYYCNVHSPGTWTLKDCGLLSQYAIMADGSDALSYPTLGQMVGKVTYSGELGSENRATLNTPITCIDYHHESGETTWRTDYVQYNGNTQ